MAGMPRGEARTVPDPDGDAYDEMCRKQRAFNDAREADLCRRARPSTARIRDTAKSGGDVLSAAELGASAFAVVSGDADDLAGVRALKKFGGKLGPSLSLTAATAGYKADRARGMAKEEALIKNGGGFVLGTGLGALGSAAGTMLCTPRGKAAREFCGGALGYMGQWDGEDMAKQLASGWSTAKRNARDAARTFGRGMSALNAPQTYIGRGRLGPDPYGRW